MNILKQQAGSRFICTGLFFLLLGITACEMVQLKPGGDLLYGFEQPARVWEETFPLGNGRIGMMPDGAVEKETIVLNEISLWSGSKQNTDNPNAYWALKEIRKLLFEGRNDEAQNLMYDTFVCAGAGSGHGRGAEVPYGSYQLLGNLILDYSYPTRDTYSSYSRKLDLSEAIASVSYKKGKVWYSRESFTSFANDVGVIHLTADMDKALNFTIGMNRPERYTVSVEGKDLLISGRLPDGVDTVELNGTRYAARLRVLLPKGGRVVGEDSTLVVQDASEAVLLISMATDYFDKDTYEEQMKTLLTEAEKKGYSVLKKEHIAAYNRMFGRVHLDLENTERSSLPIDKRLFAFGQDGNDPGLAALYFQFGRYLLLSSTRPGGLPPNLQGLWCNTINTPWNGDYHLNINLQMNLWPAEVTNLSELHLPMIEWTKKQVESGKRTAKAFYNARGWVTHILGNVWEFTAPGEHPSWGATNTSAAWLCEHLYSHYQYTLDKDYLADVYPVMKEAALFFVDMLIEDPRNGYLVTAPTTSPENAYRMPDGQVAYVCAGSTMDNQIIRELFAHTIEAAGILGIDTDFSATLAAKRARLMPTTIGADGRIMEWLEPYQEVEPTHRHISHLYGLYPANEITLEETPRLAEAARKTLEVRGDQSYGWSMAWKVCFWARLHDGERANKLLGHLIYPLQGGRTTGDIAPNLICMSRPFQIDGIFGGCAGIAEMLIQSHAGRIEFLPALPTNWETGSFSGLKVRGGGEVSAKWRDGLLKEAGLKATVPGVFTIKLPDESADMKIKKNQKAISMSVIDGELTVKLGQGEELLLLF